MRQLWAEGTPGFTWFILIAGAVDQGLVQWLQELNVDSGTIQTVRRRVLAYPCPPPTKSHLCPSFSSSFSL